MRRSLARLTSAVVIGLLILAACGQSDTSSAPHGFIGDDRTVGGGGFFDRFQPKSWFLPRTRITVIDAGPSTTTMSLALADSADPTAAGNGFSYTATLTNTGAVIATSVSCAITADSSLTVGSVSGTGWSCSVAGQVATCTRATASSGAQPAITLNVTAGDAAASITTSVSCTASNASTANASQGTTITRPVMTATLADTADPVITGADAYSYTFGLSNAGVGGAGTVNTISAAITLDASLAYQSASGTGWACGVSGQVVTCTLSTLGVGAANNVTINVKTGTSAVAASSSVTVTASNAANATASQVTTVNLVTKDATAGIYFPATSTEWSNFLARKGLAMSTPDALWLMQDASGNLADAIGSFTLTASGTGLAYQQTVSGYSRKAVTFTNGSSGGFLTSSASLPNLSTQSMLTLAVINTTTPTATRQFLVQGGAGTFNAANINVTTGTLQVVAGSTVNGATTLNGIVDVVSLQTNRTATTVTATTHAEKLTPTWNAAVAGQRFIIGGGSTATMGVLYVVNWHAAKGEATDANLKALEQAMGFTITR